MQIFDEMLFSKQLRMMRQKYENLLTLVASRITKSLVKSEVISLGERLSVTSSLTEQVSSDVSELLPTPIPAHKFPPSSS